MANGISKSLNVRWRLLAFIFFLLFMMAAAGTGGILGMRSTKQSLSTVYLKHVQPMEELRQVNDLFKFNVVGTAELLLYENTTWKDALAKVMKAKAALEQKFDSIKANNKSLLEEGKDTGSSGSMAQEAKRLVDELVLTLQSEDMDRLDTLFAAKLEPFQDDNELRINTMILDRVAAVRVEYETAQKRYKYSLWAFVITLVTGFVIGIFAGSFLMRSIETPLAEIIAATKVMTEGDLTKKIDYDSNDEFGTLIDGFNRMQWYLSELVAQIQNAGIQVTSSITEIAASTKQQEATANEHAATANEIAASTSQIAATSENLMDTMKRVNSLTTTTVHAVEEGHAGLSDIDSTMVKMEDATGAIVAKLSVLSEKASDIAGVVKTINKVADQTNLLSLNAAIEAEKAGEYGTGFAVVATEIRRLADQTAVATYDIEQMVQGVQSAVSASVMGIDKFADDVRTSVSEIRQGSERMEFVIENVQVLVPQVSTISEGIEAQSLGARQISDATSQLNEAAQQGAESIAQMSSTILQLQKAAQGLQEAISSFRVN